MSAGTFRWFIVIVVVLFLLGVVRCQATVGPVQPAPGVVAR